VEEKLEKIHQNIEEMVVAHIMKLKIVSKLTKINLK